MDALLAGLDPEQRDVATAVRGPVCVLAGAGTGKTRAITHRIAYAVATGAVQPGHVLAVTFTARAAGEMRSRLRALGAAGVQARTFHAAALRQLAYFWPRAVGGELPALVESKFPLVGSALARVAGPGARPAAAEIRDLITEIEWAKARMIAPEGYAAAVRSGSRDTPRDPGEVAAVFAAYETAKQRAGRVDFDDLLLLLCAILDDHEDVAGEVRSRYRHFVVDEYQDVNPLQQRLLDAWLGERDDLCVVGDDDQTIYSFAGASRDYLLGFPRRFPHATVVRLVRDYRSTPQVVALANAVSRSSKQLLAQRPAGPAPTFSGHDSEPEEARAVAARIRALIGSGVPAAEIAVLYRINAQSEVYEQALATAGIPYVVRGGERFFERREIREAVAALRTAGDVEGELLPAVHAVLDAKLGWRPDSPPAGGEARDRWEALAALVRVAEELPPGTGLRAYVAELDERGADQRAPAVAGVTLASLHAAKGLEWDAVFLVGLVDGTLPIQHAATDEEIAEERRLLYVGVTRAREHLALSWAHARSQGGRRSRRPSRFLTGLPGMAAPAPAQPRTERPLAACRACGAPLLSKETRRLRRCPTCPSGADEALFERLRDWRRTRADELGQPAYCVFTNATLEAIAEARPVTVADLARIPGVGPAKLDNFGREVLDLVADR